MNESYISFSDDEASDALIIEEYQNNVVSFYKETANYTRCIITSSPDLKVILMMAKVNILIEKRVKNVKL